MRRFSYKSYCWNFGTTSFRTDNFNIKIEQQLQLLAKFWEAEQNSGEEWFGNSLLQERYYDFLKENGFVMGSASNKAKDARAKTSGLVDIGLINANRQITEVGYKISEISQNGDFAINNALQISKDSFLYLRQLLKATEKTDSSVVRPLIVVLKALKEYKTLSFDEFTYFLPLCTSQEYTMQILSQIKLFRDGKIGINEVIINHLLSMPHYKEMLEWFLSLRNVTQNDICDIGANRKSAIYDKPYYETYKALKRVFLDNKKDDESINELLETIKKLKLGKLWKIYIFDKRKKPALQATIFDSVKTECDFRTAFFKVMHLLKAKATLHDYADLNRRYLGLGDIFLFADDKIELDIIPKHFFNGVIDGLYAEAYTASDKLEYDCALNEISPCLKLNDSELIKSINSEFGLNVSTLAEATGEYEKQRYARFNRLIDEKFSDQKLIELLEQFEKRADGKIQEYITNNADISTLFEYVLGIAWYKISERKGKILDYVKLSLDADLLPKSHAVGGEADIVYEYEQTPFYPKHTLLLEATLADSINQRRMELEPVSRHLGQHLLKSENLNSYCVFATTHLDINVLSDFRNRKIYPFYDKNDTAKKIKGMKIIALQSSELKTIIQNNNKYNELYGIFEAAYQADLTKLEADEWYSKYIKDSLK